MKTDKASGIKLVLAAGACSDMAEMYPEWAEVQITPRIIKRIRHLQKLCLKENLSEVTDANIWPDRWDNDDTHYMRGDRLVVTKGSVRFRAHPKEADFDVETNDLMIKQLLELATKENPVLPGSAFAHRKGAYFFASNEGHVRLLIDAYSEAGHA